MSTVAHESVRLAGGVVGIAQIAELTGYTRQRIQQLAQEPDFPKPLVGDVGPSKAYLRSEIVRWDAERTR
jgi:predicted DNA-binding transcriptional regulator AlpA